jgi:hypothetical protein
MRLGRKLRRREIEKSSQGSEMNEFQVTEALGMREHRPAWEPWLVFCGGRCRKEVVR